MLHSRLSLLLLLFLWYGNTIAQTTISGTVVDEKTGEILPYVTVWLKSVNKYSRADENGNFKVYPAQIVSGDTLVFSSIGYLSLRVAIKQSDNVLKIVMKEDVTQLREIKISGRESILGRFIKKGYQPYKGTWMITRRFISDSGFNYLKKVVIWRKPDRQSRKGKAKFRITIYNSEDNYGPPNGVVYEQILAEDTNQEDLVVDLIKYRIQLPTKYFFVGVERIDNDTKKNLDPLVYTTDDRQYSWIKFFGDKYWQHIYVKPAIAAIVM